jgi:hypothetical protein
MKIKERFSNTRPKLFGNFFIPKERKTERRDVKNEKQPFSNEVRVFGKMID